MADTAVGTIREIMQDNGWTPTDAETIVPALEDLGAAIAEGGGGGGGSGASIDLGITGASVGEVAAVAAVDGSGKPTAWTHASVTRPKVTVTITASDGTTVTGETVTLREGSVNGPVIDTVAYSGAPVAVTVPDDITVYAIASNTNHLAYITPEPVTTFVSTCDVSLSMEFVKVPVYAFHIDSTEADPSDCVTYLADAVGKTPAHMDYANGRFDWGSWSDSDFFIPRPCMLKYDGTVDYYLDPSDYSKRADGVTPSDVADPAYGGNAMMEWGRQGKQIWYKVVPDDGDDTSCTVFISADQIDSGYHAWSFVNNSGNLVDHFYTPIYNGTIVNDGTNDVLRSISGLGWNTYGCKKKTAAQERTAARHNNDELAIWDTEVYCDVILINLLLTMLCKSLDTQTAFGEGLHTSGSESSNNGFTTGVHDAKGLFWGTNSGAAGTYTNAVKVFGMENWWGFLWRRFGGLVNVSSQMKYKLTRGTSDGSSASDYVVSTNAADYTGYLLGGTFPSANGTYIQTMKWKGDGAHTPTVAAGQSNKNYCDGLWVNTGITAYAFRGGRSDGGSLVGAWCLYAYVAASHAYWDVGASPSCKPQS